MQGTGHTCVERSVSPQCFCQPFPPLLPSVQARDKNVGSGRYWPLRALLSCPSSLFSDPYTAHTLDQIWWKENISIPSVSAEAPPRAPWRWHWVSGRASFPDSPCGAGRWQGPRSITGRATKPVSHRKRPEAAQACGGKPAGTPAPPHVVTSHLLGRHRSPWKDTM